MAVAEVDRHRHCPAAADQDEGHDGDQEERVFCAANSQNEDFTGVWPRNGRRHPHRHIGEEKTAKNKGIAQEKDPYHGLSPGGTLERSLIRGPIGGKALPASGMGAGF